MKDVDGGAETGSKTNPRSHTRAEFKRAVNMTARQIGQWLGTEESKSVGWSSDGRGESVGHRSGRRIVELLDKPESDLTIADVRHMKKVVGYVRRHLAQRPEGDVSETRWRYSLMNWGHDPLKRARKTKGS